MAKAASTADEVVAEAASSADEVVAEAASTADEVEAKAEFMADPRWLATNLLPAFLFLAPLHET